MTDPARPGINDLKPSFDLYRKMLDSPHVWPPRRQATLRALDDLERRMGADWLERYWEKAGHVPPEVNLGAAHVSALGKLLDFALRFAVLDGRPGVGKVQKEMKNDIRDERRRHCALQLEVGALAARAGYTAAFEDRAQPAIPPSYVVLRRGDNKPQASGGGWLRADILDGTWVFTPWAQTSLRAKTDEITRQIKPLLAPYTEIHGAILSNGDGLTRGTLIGESARSAADCYGLRRQLPAARARETMIIATSQIGSQQASWIDLYGPEDSWFHLPVWGEIRP